MVLYCGGLFDPAPALPGQNGDCSQLMDPATTPDYQQAAGGDTAVRGRGTETGENVYFNFLSGRNSVDESTVCLSLALPPAFQISNSHCTLHSQSAFCLMHDDDLININMHMHSALQLQCECTPEMQFHPAEGKLRSVQTHSGAVELNVKCTRHHFCRDVSCCHRWLAAASSNSIQNILVRWTLSSCSTLCILILTERNFQFQQVRCLLPTIKSSTFLQSEETNEGGQQQDR